MQTATQILGTWLQFCGTVFTVAGLLWVLHIAKGRLAQLGGDAIGRWTQLLNTIDRWINQTPPPTAGVSATLAGHGQPSATAGGFPVGTTPAQVYAEVQNTLIKPLNDELTSLRNHINQLAENLRKEINDAVKAEREKDEALRKRDFIPTLIGLGLSIAGYLCQLFG